MIKELNALTEEHTTLTEAGVKRLLQVTQATSLVSELIYSSANNTVSAEGVAGLMACLYDQLESVIKETSMMRGPDS